MTILSDDWRPIGEPPGEEFIGKPLVLVCMPKDGSPPTFSNFTLGWLYSVDPLDWSLDRVPVGWPLTHWRLIGAPASGAEPVFHQLG